MMDYSGNAGKFMNPDLGTSNTWDGALVPSSSITPKKRRRLSDITDGTSSTLLVGEKFLNTFQLQQISDPNNCSEDQGWVDGWDNDSVASAIPYWNGSPQAPRPSGPFDSGNGSANCGGLFGSVHAGMQSVFCDGSVHVIAFSMTPAMFTNLLQISDGVVLTQKGID